MRKRKLLMVTPAVALLTLLAVTMPAAAAPRGSDRHDRRPTASHVERGRHDHRQVQRGGSGAHRADHRRDNKGSVQVSFGHVVHRPVHTVTHCAPGYYQTHWVPAVYQTRYDACGQPYTVLLSPGRYEQVWVPGGYTTVHHHHTQRHSSGISVRANIRF